MRKIWVKEARGQCLDMLIFCMVLFIAPLPQEFVM
jgi:hypothetical protein